MTLNVHNIGPWGLGGEVRQQENINFDDHTAIFREFFFFFIY